MKASVYTRPNKPLTCKPMDFSIKNPLLGVEIEKPKMLSVDSGTQCHTTPDNPAAFMVDCLDYKSGLSVYEPHAGTGQLINALINAGVALSDIRAGEMHMTLCEFVRQRFEGLHLEQGDFLNHSGRYDRIICNPPFKPVIKHMDHVLYCLKPGGIAVCLVPVTYNKIEHEELDRLPPDTFAHCNVHTKIIRIEK